MKHSAQKIEGQRPKAKGKSQYIHFLPFAFCLVPFASYSATSPLGSHDSRTPIEVTSDTLEVFQQENRAVFSGHVVAIQGDVRLKADTMTVHYRQSAEAPPAPKGKKAPAPAASEGNSIRQIDADGNVFLSTPAETASGNHGIYDVEHHEIYLKNDVVLTRGQNVLKGDQLTYSFDTGKSKMTGVSTSTQPGGARVRALFVPGGDEKK